MAAVKVRQQEVCVCVSVYACVCVFVCISVRGWVRVWCARSMDGNRESSWVGDMYVCLSLYLCVRLFAFLLRVSKSLWRAKHDWWPLKFFSRRSVCVCVSQSVPVFVCVSVCVCFRYVCEWESVARKICIVAVEVREQEVFVRVSFCVCACVFVCVFMGLRVCGARNT